MFMSDIFQFCNCMFGVQGMQKDTINSIKKLNTILKYMFSHLSAFGQSPYMVLMQIYKEPQNNNKIW